jgi:alkylhydroperoxidase/carboxymuconolactone decarboxylase family protein YurZ
MTMSDAFLTFLAEAPAHAKTWMAAVRGLDGASVLDKKTEELAYLAVLASQRLISGIPFHVKAAKAAGASREEVISAVLIGLPAVGNTVIEALPVALEAYDGPEAANDG